MSSKPLTIPKAPDVVKAPLSDVEEAFVAMILEEHQALVRQADARRDQRIAPLLRAKDIPESKPVRIEARTADGPAQLVYDA